MVLCVLVLLLSACSGKEVNSEQTDVNEQTAVIEQTGTITQPETTEQPKTAVQEPTKTSSEVLAIYSCPATQIITNQNNTKELADTVLYLYQDFTYVQYVDHENRYEVYSEGSFETNFDWTEQGWEEQTPHILTIYVQQIHEADHQLKFIDATYDINLDTLTEYCLYPDNIRTDLKLVAAFMQVDKQKLAKQDGSEEYLPTMWFYYDDGSFQQYAILSNSEQVLFSIGEYSVTSDEFSDQSVLTIHRTKKYQDGQGLADYDSTHDYLIEEIGFIRVYPSDSAGDTATNLAG